VSHTKIIHIIDSDTGGGAEKLVSIIYKNTKNKVKIVTLKKLSKKNKLNPDYISLNLNTNGIISIILATFKIFKILFKLKNKKNIILHSHLSRSLYATFLPSVIFRIDHIHTEHNTYNRRRSKIYLYPFEYLIYNSLKYIVCISKPTRSELISYMPSIKSSKIIMIPNGTVLYKFKKRNFSKKKYNILILGSLTYKKGIDLFINALPFIKNKIKQVKIVGSGPEIINLLNLTYKLSLNDVVKFTPYIQNPSKQIYRSDIGVLPSRWEGFGLVAAEMRSSGLPILISDKTGVHKIFGSYNGVYSFKNKSLKSLKYRLKALIYNLQNKKIKIRDLSKDFQIYSKSHFVKNYDDFYNKIKK
jgi:glycosyltransferase involved in cell wall biosynthesis